jgi:threonine dehydratase
VRNVGAETFRLCRQYVDDMVIVSNDEICAAIKDIFEDRRSILEPAGALAYAGLKRYAGKKRLRDRHLVAIASGANVNFDRLRHVAERAEIGERREAILAVTIPERPGSFRKFCALIGDHNITEFNYRYADATAARVFVGVSVTRRQDVAALVADLEAGGFAPLDFSGNEMAKLHVRHMVGGHAPHAAHEVLYRFEFPERPGALMNFLECMTHSWNISLFHYRNHGTDYGRVLIGLQVPDAERGALGKFLDTVGYDYCEETGNPAYQVFLGARDGG